MTKQIHHIVDKPKSNWYGINNTKRSTFTLDNLSLNEPNSVVTEYNIIFKLFDEIKTEVLPKIKPLGKNITLQKQVLLANFGVLKEQKPHCDYSSAQSSDPNRIIRDNLITYIR